MEIEKTLALAASPQQVWMLLLDPQAMGACVPGMESIEAVSPDEYTAVMRVKVSFISARFKLRTRIIERREPHYLLAEGTGEDASVASSLKQRTEMRLEPGADGGCDLRLRVQVDLLGRMGSFGLSAMKTKADRLWDQFGVNLAARLAVPATDAKAVAQAPETAATTLSASSAPPTAFASAAPPAICAAMPSPEPSQGWWPSLLRAIGIQPASAAVAGGMIVIEVRRADQTQFRVEWPAAKSEECVRWLRDVVC